MAKHSVQRKRKKRGNGFSFGSAVVLVLCFIGVSFGLYLWQTAFSIGQPTPTVDDDDFRPTIGEPPYRIVIDAGHGGSDPGARGVVQESEMTAATAEALSAWLERDPNYIPLTTREATAAPQNPLSAPLLPMHRTRICCCLSTAIQHPKAPAQSGLNVIRLFQDEHTIRRAIILQSSLPGLCRRQGPACGDAGESDISITKGKQNSWWRAATRKYG